MEIEKIKILHCADLHLGARYLTAGDLANERSADLIRTFDRIIGMCRDEHVDFLLIAGDLFDRIRIGSDLVSYVIEQFKTLSDTVIAIAPGNHDPLSVDSVYRTCVWPSNTIIFTDVMNYKVFIKNNVCLWGAGFGKSYEEDSKISELDRNIFPEMIHLCVLHGELVSSGQKSVYNPVSRENIAHSPFDYLALGHVHKRSEIMKEGRTYFSYCGCPEGHGFDEVDEQGVYLGTVSKGRHDLRFVRLSSRCYREMTVDISTCNSHNEISEKVIQELSETYPTDYSMDLFRVILRGELPRSFTVNIDMVKNQISSRLYYIMVYDETTRAINLEALAEEENLKGIFVKKMLNQLTEARKKKDQEEIRKLQKAIKYGLMAFEGEVLPDADY